MAMDAVLSLKVTSATVGATVMLVLRRRGRVTPAAGTAAAARSAADAVRAATPPTLGALDRCSAEHRAYLGGVTGPGRSDRARSSMR